MRSIAVIPARYDSTRFPGKPLVDLAGKTMIRRVYERASMGVDLVIVATDDERIAEEVRRFGGHVYMTAKTHATGTNRCLEAYDKWVEESGKSADIIINVQGDEPLIEPSTLKTILQPFNDTECELATLVMPVRHAEELDNPNHVFVAMDQNGRALYFSRYPIPFVRGVEGAKRFKPGSHYRHIGMYAFRPKSLRQFASMAMGELEKSESLEQLRWLEAGREISCAVVSEQSMGVDTPEDADKVRAILSE